MNKRTRKALEGSIRKWEDVRDGKIKDKRGDNCPLCALFNNHGDDDCEGCPVAIQANDRHCSGTPYVGWWRHQNHRHYSGNRNAYWATDARSKKLAQAELDFLISLRPG